MFSKNFLVKLWLNAKTYSIKLNSNKRFKQFYFLDRRYLYAGLFGSTAIGFAASSIFNYELHAKENKTNRREAIQLISENKNGKFTINPEALDILKGLNGNVAVVNCVGPYRSGKSLLLNLFLKVKDGFKVGNTEKSCTRGIWMWNNPIKHTNENGEFYLIFMDTEGIGSPSDSDKNKDNKIFILSLLLSSVFIYNTKGVIDRNSINTLGMMNQLSKYINSDAIEDSNLPDFIWALRDYQYALKDANPTKDLEDLLKSQNARNGDEIIEIQFIQDNIKKAFRSLECYYFPFPIDSGIDGMTYEETMRNLDRIDVKKLRSDFLDQVKSLHASIQTKLKPKSVNSTPLPALAFSKYIETVVERLNNNQVISIIDSSVSGLKYKFVQDKKNALRNYKTKMDAEFNTKIDWGKFEDKSKHVAENSKKEFKMALNCEHALTIPYLEEFDKQIGELHKKYKDENKIKIKSYYKNELNSTWINLESVRKVQEQDKKTGERFREARRKLEEIYKILIDIQPEKSETWKEWCVEKDMDTSERQADISSQKFKQIEEEKFRNTVKVITCTLVASLVSALLYFKNIGG